jgi:CRP-like cAMP-binding protein
MKKIKHGNTTKILLLGGETLFNQGEEGNSAYMIIHGVMDVLVDGKKISSMRDGEVFGEMALILDQKRSATIVSNQSTELISISKENLNEIIASSSANVKKIIIELCDELSKRSDFQNVPYTHEDIDTALTNENQIITKLTKQILHRLERSTNHVE